MHHDETTTQQLAHPVEPADCSRTSAYDLLKQGKLGAVLVERARTLARQAPLSHSANVVQTMPDTTQRMRRSAGSRAEGCA